MTFLRCANEDSPFFGAVGHPQNSLFEHEGLYIVKAINPRVWPIDFTSADAKTFELYSTAFSDMPQIAVDVLNGEYSLTYTQKLLKSFSKVFEYGPVMYWHVPLPHWLAARYGYA